MKPAREPSSSHPKPCASLKKLANLACSPLLVGPRRKKADRGQRSAIPSETSRFAPLILAHRGSAFPWLVNNRAALRPRRIWCVPTRYSATRLSATVIPAPRVPSPPEEHQIGARKRRAPGSTILNQPYRCLVSIDRLNCDDRQLATCLEGEPGSTPAGKTVPQSNPETKPGFGRRGYYMCVHWLFFVLLVSTWMVWPQQFTLTQ